MLLTTVPLFSGEQENQNFVPPTFKSLEINHDLNIFFSQASEYKVDVEGPEEIEQNIQVEIDKKGVLRFIFKNKVEKSLLESTKILIKSPEIENITLKKSSALSFDTDIVVPKAKIKVYLNDNAVINARDIKARKIDITLKDNSIFRGTIYASDMVIEARNSSKISISGEISGSTKIISKDHSQITVEKIQGKSTDIKSTDASIANISFNGKKGIAVSAGTANIQLGGIINRTSLKAKGNSMIDIRKLVSKNIKTSTEKSGRIDR